MKKEKPIEIKKELLPIVKPFEKKAITNQSELQGAVAALSHLNKILDRLIADKEKITKPLNVTLKEVRGRYKPAEEELENHIGSLRDKITAYQTEQVRLQRIEEAKIEARVGEGKGKLKVETAVRKMDELEKPDEEIITSAGLVKFKEVKKFRIVDFAMLPTNYLLANEVEIRKSMLAGEEVPGVEYYTEQIPLNYR